MRIWTPVWVTRISCSSSSQFRVSVSWGRLAGARPSVAHGCSFARFWRWCGVQSRRARGARVVRVSGADLTIDGLPGGLTARVPVGGGRAGGRRPARRAPAGGEGLGQSGVDPDAVLVLVAGTGSWTRRQAHRPRRRGPTRRVALGARPGRRPHARRGHGHAAPRRAGGHPARPRPVRRRGAARRRHRRDARSAGHPARLRRVRGRPRASRPGSPPPASGTRAPGSR